MRLIAVLLFLTASFAFVQAQEPVASPTPPEAGVEAETPADEVEFRAAASAAGPEEREKALAEFLEKFPESALVSRAREFIAAARAEQGARAVADGRNDDAVRLFKLAVSEAPEPVGEQLFAGVLAQIPGNVFFSGLRNEGYEIARLLEEKVKADPRKLLGVASFYLSVENAAESRRLAERAIDIDPAIPAAYQTLGLAQRLAFDLDAAEAAYAKALELDPASTVSRRSLAEIKRATGKPNEAVALYDEIIAADPADTAAGTGRTLALFDAGRLTEAEPALELQLQVNPNNLPLLVGAAYWFAANGRPEKAVELANRAVAAEPRYTWAYIALARGQMGTGRPLDAEKTLLAAKRYGNFPTLDYQLASARLAAGFYRDAADALLGSFSVADGEIRTRLGGRVERASGSFTDLLAPERKSGIFQPVSADDPGSAEDLKRLLSFITVLDAGAGPEMAAEAADRFVNGDDAMKTHRQIFAAGRLLERKVALDKVTELARAAAVGVDDSLLAVEPEAAVLADELYESRKLAIARGTLIVVPDIPKQTLSRILRGRIEEIDGTAAYERGNSDEALVHLKRALSIVPAESAWSRSVQWKMGTVLESLGRDREALDSYIASYRSGGITEGRKIVIETLYKKINGSLDGLDARLAEKPEARTTTASLLLKPEEKKEEAADPEPESEGAPETRPVSGEGPEAAEARKDPPAEVAASLPERMDENLLEDIAEANRRAMEALDLDSPMVPPKSGQEVAEEKGEATEDKKDPEAAPTKAGQPANAEASSESPAESGVPQPSGSDQPPPAAPRTRPRVVPDSRDRVAGSSDTPAECRIVLSQETAAITAGGSTGILAGVEGGKGVFSLRGVSSSPDDIRVTVDRSFAEMVGRAMFLVTSVSSKKGVYSVTFETSCGTKELQVTVR